MIVFCFPFSPLKVTYPAIIHVVDDRNKFKFIVFGAILLFPEENHVLTEAINLLIIWKSFHQQFQRSFPVLTPVDYLGLSTLYLALCSYQRRHVYSPS